MFTVALVYPPRPGPALLRPLAGTDEQRIAAASALDAVTLVDSLLIAAPWAGVAPGEAHLLTVADRDRVLAAIHREAFGERIATTIPCAACATPFDLDFSLSDLAQTTTTAPPSPAEAGWFRAADGTRFRLPTGGDELAVIHLAASEASAALLRRCTESEPTPASTSLIQQAMEALAPTLDAELDAPCPACSADNTVRFDLQTWLLTAIVQESRQRLAEYHCLARSYHWGLDEIARLTRRERKQLIALVERDQPAAWS